MRNRVHIPRGLVPSWADLRAELGIHEPFDAAVLAEAAAVAARPASPALDRTDLELFSVDPPGSRDLDQAMSLTANGKGYRVHYAIADVGAFVAQGSLLDAATRERGETYYAPDVRVPMVPPVLSEDAGSLLPEQDRPAVLWAIDIDDTGRTTAVDVRRAIVRTRQALDYETVQRAVDTGRAEPPVSLLRPIGELLRHEADRRGAVTLPTPEQQVHLDSQSRPQLTFRTPLAAEHWNEQISLLTGRAAAALMLDAKIGVLRILPAPPPDTVESLRRSALALGVDWPAGEPYGDVISRLDPAVGKAAAVLDLVPRLLRGATYTAFDGNVPDDPVHSAVGAPYAHCTAPLRRLVDRFVSEICLAVCGGTAVADWVRAALPLLPELMAGADHRAHGLDRAATDLAEAIVLEPSVGQRFDVTVVEATAHGGVVQLQEPAVRAPCAGRDLPLGERIEARLAVADPERRRVQFVT